MENKIIVVGDLHGDWGALNKLITTKNPAVIMQCGDFGWWPVLEVSRPVLYGRQSKWKLKGIKPHDTQVYWCDGNHEDHESLGTATEDRVSVEMYQNVYFMPRGSVLTLPDGRNVMFMGGADSIDKHLRRRGYDWFEEELISFKQADKALSFAGRVDIVISHTCPNEWEPLPDEFGKRTDPCRKVLSAILEKFKPDLWFHGHWHKQNNGVYNGTRWQSLDYPGHAGKWWEILK
ncbi:MAG TPA: hypothetical protein DCS09_07385 [Porphyromonadaceae bacterium]|nr:hypothetical protein [Porphyromonadaceae bacterium]